MIKAFFRPGYIAVSIWLLCSLMLVAVSSSGQARQDILTPEQKEINGLLERSKQIFESNPDSAIALVDEGLRKSRETAFENGMLTLLMQRGAYLYILGVYDSAIAYLSEGKRYLKHPQNKHKTVFLYANLGMCYSALGKYEQALNCFEIVLQEPNTDSAAALLNRGILWYRVGEYNQGVADWEQALAIARRKDNQPQVVQALLNIADVKSKDLPEVAERLFKEAAVLGVKLKIPRYCFVACVGIAHILNEKGEYRQALAYLTDSLPEIARYKSSSYEWLSMRLEMGSIYQAMKQYDKALEVLGGVYEGSIKYKHKELLLKSIPLYATVNATVGNYSKAYALQQEVATLKDSAYQNEKMNLLKAWVGAQMRTKDNALLQQKLQLLEQQGQIKNRNLWTTVIASGITILILVLSLLIYSYRQKYRREQSQVIYLKQKQEIIQLKAQVRGEEEERNRIASELHNNIAGQLWAVKMGVNMLQEEDNLLILQHKLSDIHSQLTDVTVDLRNTAHNMFPALLLENGLAAAIASLCETIRKNTGLHAEFLEYGTVPDMEPEIALSLYRIVQELVQNVVKHAHGASGFVVQLSATDNMLNITVEDDGIGFIPSELQNGMGLTHINNKIKALKGYIDFRSEVGTGTTVYLELDLLQL